MNEVLAGVQGTAPLARVKGGSTTLPKKILYLVGIRYAISLSIFCQKLLNTHTKLLRKNMVRPRPPS